MGDTAWHSDSSPDPIEYGYTRIKTALYLDAVTRDTGCLRIFPGSHRPPLHEDLEPLRHLRRMQPGYAGRTESREELMAKEDGNPPSDRPFGVDSSELPCFPLESEPGDVVFFNERLWHASFGGRSGRRMFTLNYGGDPVAEEHIALVKQIHESSLEAMKKLQHTPAARKHTDAFLESDRPQIQGMMLMLFHPFTQTARRALSP